MTLGDRIRHVRRQYGVPIGGAALVVAGTLGVIALADAATESDGLAAFDPELTDDAASRRTAVVTAIARTLTFIGSTAVLVIVSLVAAVLLWRWTRTWRTPLLFLFAMVGAAALTTGLKNLVGRKRPDITFVLGPVADSFAFPSGHTLNSTVFFLSLAAVAWVRLRSLRNKILVALVAVVMSIGIGLSRIYLGYHWATDVLAGWTVAVTWLAVVGLVVYFTRPRAEA